MAHTCICLYAIFIFVELSSFYNHDCVYFYSCHLSSGHCWKPRLSRVYTNCKMLWSQGPDIRAWGVRLYALFEMLSVVFVLVTLIVLGLFKPGDHVGSNTWIALKSYHSSLFVQTVKPEPVSRCLVKKTNIVRSWKCPPLNVTLLCHSSMLGFLVSVDVMRVKIVLV